MPPMASPYPSTNAYLPQNSGRMGPNGALPDHHSQANSNNSNEGGTSSGGGSSADQLNKRKYIFSFKIDKSVLLIKMFYFFILIIEQLFRQLHHFQCNRRNNFLILNKKGTNLVSILVLAVQAHM